jgi:hypothetical protein
MSTTIWRRVRHMQRVLLQRTNWGYISVASGQAAVRLMIDICSFYKRHYLVVLT